MSAVTALRHLPVPDVQPQLEAEGHTDATVRWAADRAPGPVQGVLALVVDGGTPLPLTDDEADFGPLPTGTAQLPEPVGWSRGLVQVLVEVMNGQRSASQLLRWTTPEVYEAVRAQTLPPPRPGARAVRRRPRVFSIHVCEPADGVAEVSAVVTGQHRTQALALRLEGHDHRWRVTALEAG